MNDVIRASRHTEHSVPVSCLGLVDGLMNNLSDHSSLHEERRKSHRSPCTRRGVAVINGLCSVLPW